MKTGWIKSIPSIDGGRIEVVRRPISCSSSSVDMSKPAVGVVHTTETSVVPGYGGNIPPHVTVGPFTSQGRHHLVQHVEFGKIGCALANPSGGVETNHWTRAQIEIVAHTTREAWLPADEEQQVIVASFFEWCQKELGIPEEYPFNPKDVLSGTWAVATNPWRRSGKWGKKPGWYGHIAVPENSHWDPGGLKMAYLLGKEKKAKTVLRYEVVASWDHRHPSEEAHRHSEALSGLFESKKAAREAIELDAAIRVAIATHVAKGHRVEIAKRRIEV